MFARFMPVSVTLPVTVSEPSINLYTLDNLHELSGCQIKEIDYLKTLIQNGIPHFVENISAEVNILKIDSHFFPLLITSGNYHNSYVCSPYGHYISLGLESLQRIKTGWQKKIVEYGLKSLGSIIKTGRINPAVYINHSLFSTDLHPNDLTKAQIRCAIHFLQQHFPSHSIIFRSINAKTCPDLKKNLKSCGFKFIASRQIYLTDMKNQELFQTRIIKSDLRLWDKKEYEVVSQNEFSDEDEQRILALCHALSIENHSTCNPKPTSHCLDLLKKLPSFQLKALKKSGVIDGVAGYHIKDNILHCSFFGYDKNHPNSTLIYRLLSTMLLLEASKNGKVFHQSAGASFYKTIRRASQFQEYQAVHIKHLPLRTQLTWRLLKTVINTFAIPFMKKY
jgi:hypothetical protein